MKKFMTLVAAAALAAPLAAMAAPEAGEKSFTVSGTGASDNDFDGNAFGVSAELGYYNTDRLLLGVRQSVNGTAGDAVADEWNGSTRGFVDYHFGDGAARPFVGANLGYIYGESVNESGTAGLELGLKYFVLDKTFISVGAEYQFLFEDGDDADDQFEDGVYLYTVGVGFNF